MNAQFRHLKMTAQDSIKMKMPEGVASVTVEADSMCGDKIVIRLKCGQTIVIDNNCLSGTHETQIGVYTGWDSGADLGLIAGVAFDPVNAPETWTSVEDATPLVPVV
jgi:hypothetical protein